MKFRVIIQDSAQRDLEEITAWIAEDSPERASKWYWRVKDAINTLESFPRRCRIAPENQFFDEEIRHLLHGKRRHIYRILFTIHESEVHVIHIRHGARRPLTPAQDEN